MKLSKTQYIICGVLVAMGSCGVCVAKLGEKPKGESKIDATANTPPSVEVSKQSEPPTPQPYTRAEVIDLIKSNNVFKDIYTFERRDNGEVMGLFVNKSTCQALVMGLNLIAPTTASEYVCRPTELKNVCKRGASNMQPVTVITDGEEFLQGFFDTTITMQDSKKIWITELVKEINAEALKQKSSTRFVIGDTYKIYTDIASAINEFAEIITPTCNGPETKVFIKLNKTVLMK